MTKHKKHKKHRPGTMANLQAMGRFLKQLDDRATAKWAFKNIIRLEEENERLKKTLRTTLLKIRKFGCR